MANQNRNKKSAFTLTELLVVIGIIGILAAVLFPVLSAAKKRAQLIQCVHNLHQQGLGLQEFLTDYHSYPLDSPGFEATYVDWYQAVAHELNTKVMVANNPPPGMHFAPLFCCPAAVNWQSDWAANNVDYAYNALGLTQLPPQNLREATDSLGLGGHFVATLAHTTSAPAIRPSEVLDPSDMLAIGDGFDGNANLIVDTSENLSRNDGFYGAAALDSYKQVSRWIHARHQGRANMVFCDGHVETLTLKFLLQNTTDAALACWNRDNLPHREELLP